MLRNVEGVLEYQLGVDITYSFGASGTLAEQLRQGAPVDVFISADATFTEDLANDGILDTATLNAFAEGRLVAVTSLEPATDPSAATAVLDPRVEHVALANPEIAPYGRAAERFLRSAGVWEAIEPRIVFGESVAHAFQFVSSGNAEIGFVPLSLFLAMDRSGLTLVEGLPSTAHQPLTQTAGVVFASDALVPAGMFVAALSGPVVTLALERFGYAPAGEPSS